MGAITVFPHIPERPPVTKVSQKWFFGFSFIFDDLYSFNFWIKFELRKLHKQMYVQ